MVQISGMSAINSGDAVLASVISNNFSQILVAVNSSALDSDNYGLSAIQSAHISTNAILSQHISNSQIVSAKISNNAVVHDKVNFASSDNGVRVLQIGAASSDMPAGGVIAARLTQTISMNSVSTATARFNWSDALDGDPGFTADPQVANPAYKVSVSSHSAPVAIQMTAVDSVSADFRFVYSATLIHTATVHVIAEGPKA